MYVCMCVCVYVCMCVCVHVFMCVCVYVSMCVCVEHIPGKGPELLSCQTRQLAAHLANGRQVPEISGFCLFSGSTTLHRLSACLRRIGAALRPALRKQLWQDRGLLQQPRARV